jgi:hypothetical protein
MMLSQDRSLTKIGYSILVSSLLLAIFHLIFFDKFYNSFVVEVEFVADEVGILVILPPDQKGRYDGNRRSQVKYSTGKQNKELTVRLQYTDEILRVHPGGGLKKKGLTIQRLSFSRFGVVERLNPKQIESYIVQTSDVTLKQIDEGLRLEFSEGIPTLYLKGYPVPRPGWLKICVYLVVLFLTCLTLGLLLYRLFSNNSVDYSLETLTVIFLLLLAGNNLDWSYTAMLLLFCLFTYSIFRSTIAFSRYGVNRLVTISIRPVFITSCFLFIVVWPLYRAISPDLDFVKDVSKSISDFRSNAEEETLHNRLKSLINVIERKFSSHFPYRYDLVNLNADTKIFRLGFTPTSRVILGKNGMFFEGYGHRRVESEMTGSFDNITDYMGLSPFSEEDLRKWLICLEERYYWLKEQGIDYVFALAPTKALVYPENLPSRILNLKMKLNRPTRYDQLMMYLKENSIVPAVDLRSHLIAAKQHSRETGTNNDLLLYYKTDFHWNYYGSFVAYQAIIDEINRAYPKYQFEASQLEEFTIHRRTDWVSVPFIYMLGMKPAKHKNETYLTFFPKPGSIYSGIGTLGEKGISDKSSPPRIIKVFGGVETKVRLLQNENAEVPLIFVIGDSFSEKYFGYFSKHAKNTINFRTVYSFLPEIYIDNSPDLVIQEVLNMYLLEKPPLNPEGIRGARVKALAGKEENTTVIVRKN